MRRHRITSLIIAFALALFMTGAAGAVTAFAVPASEPDAPVEEPPAVIVTEPEVPEEYPPGDNDLYEEPQDVYDYYYGEFDDVTSAYEAPAQLEELPTAAQGEVQEATSVTMPVSELTDSALFSGIVLWLCVALGIAVIVGVLVSRRTHRRG